MARGALDLLSRIGKTPLIPLTGDYGLKGRIFAKLEWYNPFGSLKDRAAYWMIRAAEKARRLKAGQTVLIEPTSGNTGIALTGIARLMGYQVEVVIPEKASRETKALIEALGGKLLETEDDLCPRVGKGTDQSIALAEAIVRRRPEKYVMLNQYQNEANFLAHYEATGPEVWEATGGNVRHFFAGIGTGGTITGVAKFLKEKNSSIRVYGVTPQPNHHIQGLRNLKESSMPQLLERRASLVDEWMEVSDKDAFEAVRLLDEKEGVFVGPSSGAVMAATLRIAGERDGDCVAVFADDGRKFQSLFAEFKVFTREKLASLVVGAKYLPELSLPLEAIQKAA